MKHDLLWLSESYTRLLFSIANLIAENAQRMLGLSYQKLSTQQEIYKRLLVAREYLHSNLYNQPTIEELSKISLLSANLLIRAFKQVFTKTPHQYLMELKMEKAKELLLKNESTIIDVCHHLNLHSVTTFTNYFKRQTGVSPMQFRQKGDWNF